MAGEVGIRVRMYRVGFGDFFLLSFLDDGGPPLHVVIDCGVFKGTSQTGDIHSIEAAVEDLVQVTGKQVALIIMTHRHADHIAGFARCAEDFANLTVGGVWMPIWESEYEPTAVKFQAELTRTALALYQHFAGFGARASEAQDTARKYMENATGESGAGARGSNAVALALLKRGFRGITPRYYKSGDKAELPKALADAGLSAQILGPPPVDDLALMKLMDLQKNVGQYLDRGDDDAPRAFAPFGTEWEVDPAKASGDTNTAPYAPASFREWVDPRRNGRPVTSGQANKARHKMELALRQSQPVAALTAAKQLNAFLNNQSLVVLFTFRGKKLLFVGDAQAGNWEHWLFETDTPDKTGGAARTDTPDTTGDGAKTDTPEKKPDGAISPLARQILTSLDFYKVGHHGSGNATPKVAAEMMGTREDKFAAMCSTQAGVYGTEDPDDATKGTEVPRIPLLEKLASESALVRSDQVPITVAAKQIPAEAPAPLPAATSRFRFEQGTLWVDCYL